MGNNNDFRETFLGADNDKRAEEEVNSFGDGFDGFEGGFEGGGDDYSDGFGDFSDDQSSADSFINRFSNDNDDFGDFSGDGNYDNFNDGGKQRTGFFGIASGIVGTLLATKLFSMIDKNGSISRMLGIDVPNQQEYANQQGGMPNQQAQQMQQTQGGGSNGSLGITTVIGILLGVGIILFFVFYIASFFMHDNLGPSGFTGTTESSDMTPFLSRMTGKKTDELYLTAGKDYTDIVPYRFDRKTKEVYLYLPGNTAVLPYNEPVWKENYGIDKLDKVGYMYVNAFINNDGSLRTAQPKAVYISDKAFFAEEFDETDQFRATGITKSERDKIQYFISEGKVSGWFTDYSNKPYALQKAQENNEQYLRELDNASYLGENKLAPVAIPESNMVSPRNEDNKEIVVKPAEENKLADPEYQKKLEEQRAANALDPSKPINHNAFQTVRVRVDKNHIGKVYIVDNNKNPVPSVAPGTWDLNLNGNYSEVYGSTLLPLQVYTTEPGKFSESTVNGDNWWWEVVDVAVENAEKEEQRQAEMNKQLSDKKQEALSREPEKEKRDANGNIIIKDVDQNNQERIEQQLEQQKKDNEIKEYLEEREKNPDIANPQEKPKEIDKSDKLNPKYSDIMP